MAWLATIPRSDAVGDLAQTYAAMAARPIPEAYRPPHDDAPGIVRAHSLDAELMRRTFAVSASLHQSTLDWADRELISSVTSRTNQCFY
jgi:alkylhydroperoxidase family enzyme